MIGEIRGVAESIFLGGDLMFIGMVALAALVGVFAMRNVGQLFCVSLLAMIVLGVILMVFGGATSEAPTDPATYMNQLNAGWSNLAEMSGATLVSYLVIFAVAIGILFIGKSLIFRG